MKITPLVVMVVEMHVGLHTHMNLDLKTLAKESSDNLMVNPLVKRNSSSSAGALLLMSTRDRH